MLKPLASFLRLRSNVGLSTCASGHGPQLDDGIGRNMSDSRVDVIIHKACFQKLGPRQLKLACGAIPAAYLLPDILLS